MFLVYKEQCVSLKNHKQLLWEGWESQVVIIIPKWTQREEQLGNDPESQETLMPLCMVSNTRSRPRPPHPLPDGSERGRPSPPRSKTLGTKVNQTHIVRQWKTLCQCHCEMVSLIMGRSANSSDFPKAPQIHTHSKARRIQGVWHTEARRKRSQWSSKWHSLSINL